MRVARGFWKAAGLAYEHVSPLARRLLPMPVKQSLLRFASRLETKIATEVTHAEPPCPLRDFEPLLPPEAFANAELILQVNNALAWGGAERQLVNTMLGVQARTANSVGLLCLRLGYDKDHDFHLSSLSGFHGFVRNIEPDKVAEAALKRNFDPGHRAALEDWIAWLPVDVRDHVRRLVADFATLRPAVVHAWQDGLSIEAGIAARLVGVPRVVLAGRNLAPTHFSYFRPYMRDAYRQLAGCDDVIMINNSEAGVRDYAAWLGLQAERIQVLRNGLDLSALERAPKSATAQLRASLNIPMAAPLIGSIHRFFEEKRPLLWVETAARVAAARPDAHFAVFGLGPLLSEARALAGRRGFAERFHTPGATQNVATALSAMDAFLLTSQFEGTPNVVLEASALGVPVIATSAGGTAEAICEGVSGYVVDPPNPDALGLRVLGCLADTAFRERCAEEAPRFVEQVFGLQRMLDETLALYGIGG